MNDRSDFDGILLPPELAELDAELSSLRYEERPSFRPELEAELAREWQKVGARRHLPVRQLLAASVAALLMVGFSVPSARASLVRLVEVLQGDTELVEEAPTVAPRAQSIPAMQFEEPAPLVSTGAPSADVATPRSVPPPEPALLDRYEGPEATFPELLDRPGVRARIRENYPVHLQSEGIGGVVGLRLWVDSSGRVEVADLSSSSGEPELDRAALDLAPSFSFEPARRRGRAVGTWVEFDVRFEVLTQGSGPIDLPEIRLPARTEIPIAPESLLAPEWLGDMRTGSDALEAAEALRSAIGDDELVLRLGPIEAILSGDPPAGAAPTRWKAEVGDILEAAVVSDPDNPAPVLALARIRSKQGLRTEARVLYERGLRRAQRSRASVSPTIIAELHYERGTLVRESWLAVRATGRVPAGALATGTCPQARSSGEAASGFASADRLIAWNYLCPRELGEVFEASFEGTGQRASPDLSVMMASYRAAVDAVPGHVGANVASLLTLADQGRWLQVLDGARRFVGASQGHPYGRLLAGLALHRLSRTEEAQDQFQRALRELPTHETRQLNPVTDLLTPQEVDEFRGLADDEEGAWIWAFWGPLDPILSTSVNEREVEHLARASYAYLRFGGHDSDAREVWVRYGRPSQVRVVSEGSGLRTEFWDYGTGPDITFRRLAASEDMALTSEGRAYVDELSRAYPHQYGSESRLVMPLDGQVGRFRGESTGASSVLMHVAIPELPGNAQRDTLDLGVFLLRAGEATPVDRRRVSTSSAPVTLRVQAGSDVEAVLVEVYNSRTGHAGALRTDLGEVGEESGLGVSDLVLVRPEDDAPAQLSGSAAWVQPYTLAEPVDGPAVGALFELYRIETASTWYRVRAEVENQETGEVTAVGIKPAGEEEYRPSWDRRPSHGGRTLEFANILVGDVPEGRYVLRIWADLPDAGPPLGAERVIELR